jgi:predicted DsbA family dithiol-disulfide isomerase
LEITVRWTAFPLHPETPPEGLSLEELFAGRNIDIPAMLAQMRRVAAGEGLPFGDRRHTYNSRLAQELGKWAETQGRGDAFHRLAFRAYFADGKNIAQPSVLCDLAEAAGLSPVDAETVLRQRRFAAAVDQDWQRSRQMGVTAVPTFVASGRRLVGAQPYPKLLDLVTGRALS